MHTLKGRTCVFPEGDLCCTCRPTAVGSELCLQNSCSRGAARQCGDVVLSSGGAELKNSVKWVSAATGGNHLLRTLATNGQRMILGMVRVRASTKQGFGEGRPTALALKCRKSKLLRARQTFSHSPSWRKGVGKSPMPDGIAHSGGELGYSVLAKTVSFRLWRRRGSLWDRGFS